MADLNVTKTLLTARTGGLAQTPKVGPSKFDLIRTQIAQRLAADVKLSPAAPPPTQHLSLTKTELRQPLRRSGAISPPEAIRQNLTTARAEMDRLTDAVGKLPDQPASSPLRERLEDLERQFQKSGDLIFQLNDMDPKSLLNAQMQLYQLSGNIGLMSKLVEQASSGVKTMLQIQI